MLFSLLMARVFSQSSNVILNNGPISFSIIEPYCRRTDLNVQVPEVDTAIRSLTVMWDGSLVIASNNKGTCYVWRVSRKKNQVLDIIHDTTIQNNYQMRNLYSVY